MNTDVKAIMKEAINNFDSIRVSKKIIILGDMLELGKESYNEHIEIIRLLETVQCDNIILVGPEFNNVKTQIACLHFNNVDELKLWFNNEEFSDTFFLIKGSRKIGLEGLLL